MGGPQGSDYLSWARSGELNVGSVAVSKLATDVDALLDGAVGLRTGAVNATFSDGTVTFSVAQVQVSAEGDVTLSGGGLGAFQAHSVGIDSVEGTVGDETSMTLNGLHLGPVTYDDGNIHLDLDDLVCDAVVVGDTSTQEPEFDNFTLRRALAGLEPLEDKRIVSIGNIQLDNAHVSVSDLSAFTEGEDAKPTDLRGVYDQWFGSAQAMAAETSGEVHLTMDLAGKTWHIDLDIQEGVATGSAFGIPVSATLFEKADTTVVELVASGGGVRLHVLGMDISDEVADWAGVADLVAPDTAGPPEIATDNGTDIDVDRDTDRDTDIDTDDDIEPRTHTEPETEFELPNWTVDIELGVAATTLKLGGKAELIFAPQIGDETSVTLSASGDTANGLDIDFGVNIMAAQVPDVSGFRLTTGSISIHESSNIQLGLDGRTPSTLEATILSGSISNVSVRK